MVSICQKDIMGFEDLWQGWIAQIRQQVSKAVAGRCISQSAITLSGNAAL